MDYLQVDFRDKALFLKLFGEDVYAVGGFIRDYLRKDPSEDVDILILKHPVEEIVAKLKPHGRVDLVGKSFGVIKFTREGKTYDIALPRIDQPKETRQRTHKDFKIITDPHLPLERDLSRRDFRCNSIALRLADGRLFDPFHGRADIDKKILRMTNPEAFPEDPLRVLRAARFASILHFSIDAAIYELAQEIDLQGLSQERINDELFRLLLNSSDPSRGLQEFFKLGVLKQLFPELYQLTLAIQDALFHPETDEFGHHTVWPHTLITVDQAARLGRKFKLSRPKTLCLLLAALFHDVGKPRTADWEYKNGRLVLTNKRHDILGEKITAKAFDRMKLFSWEGVDVRTITLNLIRCHHRPSELWQNREVITRKALNRLAADVDGEIELLILLDVADRSGRSPQPISDLDREGQWLKEKFEELNVSRETIKPIIMGRHLLPLGVEPGPAMGKILKKIYELQLDNEFQTLEEGLKIAQKIVEKTRGRQEKKEKAPKKSQR
ncbi:HD domain-containing protein [Candidatus Aminicenantes bacterium AC-334-K16]|jgi:tRNA nucleotidyltransferase (CCA-adding enzyme)|nr:HD domain-containing protein [Candidatus Aminicenantes bacterium AC-334-K16]